ncbi:uncharacterized protein LOC134718259 [Mytilus trossulus]|uniref:uncharacterized protein LOC134718259 n=1 Tax=Mytilus trossulus TaxID=6551 RepID=UPI003003A974
MIFLKLFCIWCSSGNCEVMPTVRECICCNEVQKVRSRYTSYRQFVRWCWQFFGKEVRVVISSCAVLRIRSTFPCMNYTGFQQ